MVRGECVAANDTVEGFGRCRESKDVRHECAGLNLLGEAGDPLRPDPRDDPVPPLANEVVEPSLAKE